MIGPLLSFDSSERALHFQYVAATMFTTCRFGVGGLCWLVSPLLQYERFCKMNAKILVNVCDWAQDKLIGLVRELIPVEGDLTSLEGTRVLVPELVGFLETAIEAMGNAAAYATNGEETKEQKFARFQNKIATLTAELKVNGMSDEQINALLKN